MAARSKNAVVPTTHSNSTLLEVTKNLPLTVRQAVRTDVDSFAPMLDQYRQIYKRTSDLAAARSFLIDRFNHGESVLFLAYAGDTVLRFTHIYPTFSSVSLARVLIFNDLFVLEGGRKRGIGKALIAVAAQHAKTLGAVCLSVSTAKTNVSICSTPGRRDLPVSP